MAKKHTTPKKKAKPVAVEPPKIRVRMYRQGLGDCFLVTFNTGPNPVHMLVDCGTLGATTTNVAMADVVKNIAGETGSHLDLLVVTHEHKDHVSGFVSERAAFDAIQVDRVWLAWTENPKDTLAQKVEKYKHDLLESLTLTGQALLTNDAADRGERLALRSIATGVRELLDFVGELPRGDAPLAAALAKTVNDAMDYASMKSGKLPDFLSPGGVIEPNWLPGVRFYVLGPPRNEQALKTLGEHGSPELYELATQFTTTLTECARFFASEKSFQAYREALDPAERLAFEGAQPFDARFRLECNDRAARAKYLQSYDDPAAAWRHIDYDWMASADDLALQLDNATNNTSLVLAIELVDDGRVLLMPADAQLGNWLSWEDVSLEITDSDGSKRMVASADLLKRTVLYKVGHHSSHNATIKQKGLELMQRDDLVAIIPVDSAVAKKKNWAMPAKTLYEALLVRTRGRVLRSDIGWAADNDRPDLVTKEEWDAARAGAAVKIEDLFIDVSIT